MEAIKSLSLVLAIAVAAFALGAIFGPKLMPQGKGGCCDAKMPACCR